MLAVEEVLAIMATKYYWKWRIEFKKVYPNKVDKEEAVFSKYIDKKLPKKVISKLRSLVKKLNHLMWGGKDYDTLDSLTRILNPDEVSLPYILYVSCVIVETFQGVQLFMDYCN